MWLPSLYLQYTHLPPPPPPPPFIRNIHLTHLPLSSCGHILSVVDLYPPPPPPPPHSIICYRVATFQCYIYLWPLPFPSCGNLLSAPPPIPSCAIVWPPFIAINISGPSPYPRVATFYLPHPPFHSIPSCAIVCPPFIAIYISGPSPYPRVATFYLPPPPIPPNPFHSIMCHSVATFHCYISLTPPVSLVWQPFICPPPPATKYTAVLYVHVYVCKKKTQTSHTHMLSQTVHTHAVTNCVHTYTSTGLS